MSARTRLFPSDIDETVLREIGEHLGGLLRSDLATRCRLGAGYKHLGRAKRKRVLTSQCSSRWAGAITRVAGDMWERELLNIEDLEVRDRRELAELDRHLSLKSCLRFYGVDAFVAHDDIQPGKEWQFVIESALHACDALAGLLHEGFRESAWCDQEVGIAWGRGIAVVPIQFDLLPYGFFGSVQAVNNAATKPPKTLARNLVQVLLKDKRTSDKLTKAIVDELACAASFGQANELSRFLAKEAPLLSTGQAAQLRKAEKENDQLQKAYDFDGHLSSIEAKIHATHDVDEEPF